jgi:hypothetical protein
MPGSAGASRRGELGAATSALRVVGILEGFRPRGDSTSTNPRQIAKRICRGYRFGDSGIIA